MTTFKDYLQETERWKELPEVAQILFDFTPDDLIAYTEAPIALGDNMPEEHLVQQMGAIMSRNGLPRILAAIAINCMNEGGNNSEVSERFGSYVIPLRLTIDYIVRTLRRPSV